MSFATEPVEEATAPNSRPDWLRSKNTGIIARPRTGMVGGYTTSSGTEETMMRTSALPGADSDYIKNGEWYARGYNDKLAELKVAEGTTQQSTQNWQGPAAPVAQPMTHLQSVQQPAPTWQGPAKPAAQPMTMASKQQQAAAPNTSQQFIQGMNSAADVMGFGPNSELKDGVGMIGMAGGMGSAAAKGPGLLRRVAPGVADKVDNFMAPINNAIGGAKDAITNAGQDLLGKAKGLLGGADNVANVSNEGRAALKGMDEIAAPQVTPQQSIAPGPTDQFSLARPLTRRAPALHADGGNFTPPPRAQSSNNAPGLLAGSNEPGAVAAHADEVVGEIPDRARKAQELLQAVQKGQYPVGSTTARKMMREVSHDANTLGARGMNTRTQLTQPASGDIPPVWMPNNVQPSFLDSTRRTGIQRDVRRMLQTQSLAPMTEAGQGLVVKGANPGLLKRQFPGAMSLVEKYNLKL